MFLKASRSKSTMTLLLGSLFAASIVFFPASAEAAQYTLTCTQTGASSTPFNLTINNSGDEVVKESAKDCGGDLIVPEGVRQIGFGAFVPWTPQNTPLSNPHITSVSLPSTLQTLAPGALINLTSVSNLVIPASVTSIGHQAFQGMSSLQTVRIEGSATNTPTTIDYFALNLTSVDLVFGSGKIVLQGSAIAGTALRSLDLGMGIVSIGSNAFISQPLDQLTIPASVTTISSQAFANMPNLQEVKFGSSTPGITSIAPNTFAGTNIQSVQYCGGNSVLDAFLTTSLPDADVYCDASVTPNPPTIVSVSPGSNQATVIVAPGAENSGPAPRNYAVQYSSDSTNWSTFVRTPASRNTSITVPSLTNEVSYEFRVAAINQAGTSSYSATSSPVSPQAQRYGITYSAGTGIGTPPTEATVFLPGESATLKSATTISKENFTFSGWSDGSTTYQAGSSYRFGAADVTLTAVWVQNSLYGIDSGDLTLIGSLTAGGIDTSITGTSGGSTVTVGYVSGGLPTGTVIDVHLLASTARARSVIATTDSFILSFVVAWLAPDGTVPTTAAGKPISMTIVNPLIKRGASVYSVFGTTATLTTTATTDGSVTISITEDPEIVITLPSAAPAPGGSAGNTYQGPVPVRFNESCVPAGIPSAIVLSGDRLESISSADVDGKTVSLSEQSRDSVKLNLPALSAGTYDVSYRSSYGLLTQTAALKVCASASPLPVTASPELEAVITSSPVALTERFIESKRFSGLQPDKAGLSRSTMAAIVKFVRANPGLTKVTCVGSTSGTRVTRLDLVLAQKRAELACNAVKKLAPGIATRVAINVGRGNGKFFRAVSVFAAGTKPSRL